MLLKIAEAINYKEVEKLIKDNTNKKVIDSDAVIEQFRLYDHFWTKKAGMDLLWVSDSALPKCFEMCK